MAETSSTYGDLVGEHPAIAARIEPHEWDNKTPSEQRDWALAQLASLDWSEITPENLPKLGDELWRSIDADNDGISVQAVDAEMISENWTVGGYAVEYWTHFRKINAPVKLKRSRTRRK